MQRQELGKNLTDVQASPQIYQSMSSHEQINSLAGLHDDARSLLFSLVNENFNLRQQIEQMEDRLLPTVEAMKFLGCGRNKFFDLAKLESFPKAIQLGKSNSYKLNELKEFRNNLESNLIESVNHG